MLNTLRIRIVVVVSLIGILVAVRPVYNVGVQLSYWQPISRPSDVSKSAHYVSLVEDGTWFDCSLDEHLDVNWCTAWDRKGREIARGAFQLEGEHRAARVSELHPSLVEASQGHVYGIYLFRTQTFLRGGVDAFSRKLVPVEIIVRRDTAYVLQLEPGENKGKTGTGEHF